MKHGKKYTDSKKLVDRSKLYDLGEACDICISTAKAKFDETVELHVRLGVDSRHADQQVRGAVVLPNGTGKNVKVLVIAKGDNEKAALEAGADLVGAEEMVAKIQNEGFMDFDVLITSPDMMGLVGRLGRVLGPRGLMPNPKAGTVTTNIAQAVNEAKAGKVEYRLDKANIIHVPVGKASFGTEKLSQNIETLMDYVQSPYFTEESVRKEQGIIGQEIRMYDDNGGWKLFFNFLNCLYQNHPVKKEIAGTVESISHITPEYLYKCYNTFYNLSNMSIVVVGNVDAQKTAQVIENSVKKNEPFEEEIKKIYPEEPDEIATDYAEQKLSVAMPLFMLGFKDTDTGFDGEKLLKKSIEINILLQMLFGKSSKLYRELYEKGLINNSFSLEYTMQPDYGYSSIDGESAEPKTVYNAVLDEIERVRKEGLCEKDFERMKKVMWGRYIRSQNDVEDFAGTFLQLHFMGIDYFNYYDVYKTVTFEDVKKRFEEHFVKERSALSVINPV